jgi:hypothetical protein
MTPSPIILNLYDPATGDKLEPKVASFVPWKMLKRAIRLQKQLGDKDMSDYSEEDVDAITNYIISVFPSGLTVDQLDEQADLIEMMAVIRSIMARAQGVMDPTLPPKA